MTTHPHPLATARGHLFRCRHGRTGLNVDGRLRGRLDPPSDEVGEREAEALAGDGAGALAHLADTVDAQLIVVGSRSGGVRASTHDFVGGSVAVQLIHRQSRPVLVVPVEPSPSGTSLPWEDPA